MFFVVFIDALICSHYQATEREVANIMKVLVNFCADEDEVGILRASVRSQPSPDAMEIVPWRGIDDLGPAPVCGGIVEAPSRAPSRSAPMV